MQKVLLGGDRLGSGGKMKVNLHPYERSTHDLSYVWRSSQAPGTLIPFMVIPALPGDTFDIQLNADVKTHPTLGPLFGSFKLQLDIFECPVRLYHSALMQNTTQIGNNMQNVLLPVIENAGIPAVSLPNILTTVDNSQINSSALLAYLGLRGWGLNIASGTPSRNMNALPFLAYWEIYKNYYANKQELNGMYIIQPTPTTTTITGITLDGHALTQNGVPPGLFTTGPTSVIIISYTGGTPPTLNQILFNTNQIGIVTAAQLASWTGAAGTLTSNTGTVPSGITIAGWSYAPIGSVTGIRSFPLTNIDNVKTGIMASPPTARYTLTYAAAEPYGPPIDTQYTTGTQCGLALKTYQSDLFNNWMQTTWITAIATATAISTGAGSFTIDSLVLARKVYDLLNRIAISGGTYHDWINAAYDHEPYSMCNSPVYHGGLSKEVVFQELNSTAQANGQPLGTLAGRGKMNQKHKGGHTRIKINEHAYLIGIVSITPRIDYSQGNNWDMYGLLTMNDFHKPALDQIGFQTLITEQMAWWDTHWNNSSGLWEPQSAGYQPAWLNYQTNYNKTYGNFGIPNNEMFMTLNRRYQINSANGHINDLTTYIDPSHYNFIFAQTNLDAQNFWTQIGVDITARRKMSAKIMPNL